MNLTNNEISQIKKMVSSERFEKYCELVDSDQAAIELHQDIIRLGAALAPIIATIEIALRNTVYNCLKIYFKHEGWLESDLKVLNLKEQEKNKIILARKQAQKALYSKMSQADKRNLDTLDTLDTKVMDKQLSHEDRSKKRQKKIMVSYDQVIANTTMYFWKRLYSTDYQKELWDTALKKTFPNKKLKRKDVAENLEIIYQTRNRLAHHEPVYGYRMDRVISAINFIINNLGRSDCAEDSGLKKLLNTDLENLSQCAERLKNKINPTPPSAAH